MAILSSWSATCAAVLLGRSPAASATVSPWLPQACKFYQASLATAHLCTCLCVAVMATPTRQLASPSKSHLVTIYDF